MNNLSFTAFSDIAYLVVLGMTPSMLWLAYFLRQDNNPEPKKMVWKVFFAGFLSTFVAFALEWVLIKTLIDWHTACLQCDRAVLRQLETGRIIFPTLLSSFTTLAGLGFIEEWVKYAAAKTQILNSAYFDEPVDAMMYLIIAALGFAAAENIGYVFQNADWAIAVAYFRFISSTFLHVLASAIIGYFFALSIIWRKSHIPYLAVGIALAVALHTTFNFLIMTSDGKNNKIFPLAFLMLGSFTLVSYLFDRIKKLTFQDATIPSLHKPL